MVRMLALEAASSLASTSTFTKATPGCFVLCDIRVFGGGWVGWMRAKPGRRLVGWKGGRKVGRGAQVKLLCWLADAPERGVDGGDSPAGRAPRGGEVRDGALRLARLLLERLVQFVLRGAGKQDTLPTPPLPNTPDDSNQSTDSHYPHDVP